MPPQRYALATFIAAGLILYGGLFPFSGWTFADPLALFRGATAYRIIRDDIFVNVVVFIPLGFCAWRAARQRHGLWHSLALAAILGFSLSLVIELFQAFLPSRKSSLADVVCNLAGSVLGGLVALSTARQGSNLPFHANLYRRYFADSPQAPLLLLAVALWTLATLTPAAMAGWYDINLAWPIFTRAEEVRKGDLMVCVLNTLGLVATVLAFSDSPARLLRVAAAYATGVFLLSALAGSRSISFENVVGALFAFAVAFSLRGTGREWKAKLGLWMLAMAFVLSESLPGDRAMLRSFNWIPLQGHLARPVSGMESLLQITWPVIAAACALRAMAPKVKTQPAGLLAFCVLLLGGFFLEYRQTQLPGRYADITVPLVMASVWLACWQSRVLEPASTDGVLARGPDGGRS